MVLGKSRYVTSSVGRYFGSRRFATADESRNVPWLALASFGESWHDNHHAFPRSYRYGPRRHELDISALVVAGLEKVGLAWDVIRVDPTRMDRKTGALPCPRVRR
jgi:stearoyl-CoA desaturase (delta-9 desaturase)